MTTIGNITPIDRLELSARSRNALLNAGIKTVGEIPRQMSKLRRIQNLGEVSCLEILRALERLTPSDDEPTIVREIEADWWAQNRKFVAGALKWGAPISIVISPPPPDRAKVDYQILQALILAETICDDALADAHQAFAKDDDVENLRHVRTAQEALDAVRGAIASIKGPARD